MGTNGEVQTQQTFAGKGKVRPTPVFVYSLTDRYCFLFVFVRSFAFAHACCCVNVTLMCSSCVDEPRCVFVALVNCVCCFFVVIANRVHVVQPKNWPTCF